MQTLGFIDTGQEITPTTLYRNILYVQSPFIMDSTGTLYDISVNVGEAGGTKKFIMGIYEVNLDSYVLTPIYYTAEQTILSGTGWNSFICDESTRLLAGHKYALACFVGGSDISYNINGNYCDITDISYAKPTDYIAAELLGGLVLTDFTTYSIMYLFKATYSMDAAAKRHFVELGGNESCPKI